MFIVHCFETLPQKSALSCRHSARVDFETRNATNDRHSDEATTDTTDRVVTGHLRSKVSSKLGLSTSCGHFCISYFVANSDRHFRSQILTLISIPMKDDTVAENRAKN